MYLLFLKYKKLVATIALLVLIIPLAVSVSPHKAEAVIGFGDTVWILGGVSIVTANLVDDNKEYYLDSTLGWLLVNSLIAAVGKNIVDWINSGFDGDPLFISNPRDFLFDIANETTGLFIQDTIAGQLFCDPYRPQILIALTQVDTYSDRAQCTLLDVVDNIDGFLDDFSQGGWAGWIQLTQNPENNVYGSFNIALEERNRRLRESLGHAQNEVSQNQGFRSLKRCKEGTEIIDIDEDGNEIGPSTYCRPEDREVLTPGQAVIGQMNQALGAPLQRLGQADEVTEGVLAAILDALINQLVTSGLRSLSDDGGDGNNLYLNALDEDRDKLLATIDNTIRENGGVAESNETIIGILATIIKIDSCYEEQKATINSPIFNPPIIAVVPTITEINDKQEVLTGNARKLERLIDGVRSENANQQIEHLRDLKERILLADEEGLLDAISLAGFWVEHSDILFENDLPQRAQDLNVIKEIEEDVISADAEAKTCKARLNQLKTYLNDSGSGDGGGGGGSGGSGSTTGFDHWNPRAWSNDQGVAIIMCGGAPRASSCSFNGSGMGLHGSQDKGRDVWTIRSGHAGEGGTVSCSIQGSSVSYSVSGGSSIQFGSCN